MNKDHKELKGKLDLEARIFNLIDIFETVGN